MKDNLIAIDTEYNANGDKNYINKVFCIAACDSEEHKFVKWFNTQDDPNILDEIASYLKISDPLFICHNFEGAERKALLRLGVDIKKYNFADTYLIELFLTRHLGKTVKTQNKDKNKDKNKGLNLVAITKRYGFPERDKEMKEKMRNLCIKDTTEGHEHEIMDYCFDDVKDLIPIYKKQREDYREAIKCTLNIHRGVSLAARFNNHSKRYWDLNDDKCLDNIFIRHTEFTKAFGAVSDIGLPIDFSRLEHFKKRADIINNKLVNNLLTYDPNLFKVNKDGTYSKNALVLNSLLSAECDRLNLRDYPITKSGLLKTDIDTLKDYFKELEGFGHDYYTYKKRISAMTWLQGSTLEHIRDNRLQYDSLRPFGAITGRSQPGTKYFIFGWWKGFYPVLQPLDDKTWLVELDFKAQETFFQAALCKDQKCYDAYSSKDMYMYFLNQFGIISDYDWNTMSTEDLKEKYFKQRKAIKTVILGTSYGMGVNTLARRKGISVEKARNQINAVNAVLNVSDGWKKELYNLCDNFTHISTDDFMITQLPICNDSIYTQMKNYSFQSMGATVLRWIVRELYNNPSKYRARPIATIHDAIVFECQKGDLQAIKMVYDMMIDLANYYSLAPDGWTIRVDDPEIVEKGDWFVDSDNFQAFIEAWTDDTDEQALITHQYKEQQARNKRYIEQFKQL